MTLKESILSYLLGGPNSTISGLLFDKKMKILN